MIVKYRAWKRALVFSIIYLKLLIFIKNFQYHLTLKPIWSTLLLFQKHSKTFKNIQKHSKTFKNIQKQLEKLKKHENSPQLTKNFKNL